MLKSFLTNGNINYLNLHFSVQAFANGFGNLFIGVFLYQAGIPLWQIFLAFGASLVVRLIFRPFALKLCFRYGLKKVLIIGTIFFALNYPLLGQVVGLDAWFYLFFIVFALTDDLYWLPYHTIFTLLGDKKHRGRQTGLRDGLIKISEFLAPLVSGILVITYGYWAAFGAAMFFMLISLVPLIKIPEIETKHLSTKSRQPISKEGFWLFVGNGFFSNHSFTWKLILFLFILNPAYFGGLIGLAVLFELFLNMFVGHLFDKGKGKIISRIGTLIIVLAVLGRGIFVDTIPEVIFYDIIFAIGLTLYMPIFDSAFYNFSKSSKHPLWYHYYAEIGWDIGAIAASLITAFIVYTTNDLRLAMMISLAGLLITNHILTKYFRKE